MAKTSYLSLSNGTRVPYREVYVHDLDAVVLVTSEEVYDEHIAVPSVDDDKFYCYVHGNVFRKLSDKALEEYVNRNF